MTTSERLQTSELSGEGAMKVVNWEFYFCSFLVRGNQNVTIQMKVRQRQTETTVFEHQQTTEQLTNSSSTQSDSTRP